MIQFIPLELRVEKNIKAGWVTHGDTDRRTSDCVTNQR